MTGERHLQYLICFWSVYTTLPYKRGLNRREFENIKSIGVKLSGIWGFGNLVYKKRYKILSTSHPIYPFPVKIYPQLAKISKETLNK